MSVDPGNDGLSVQETLQLAVEAAAIGVWELTLPTNQIRWSPRCNEIFGLPLETELSYEKFLESIHSEDRPEVDEVVRAVLQPNGTGNYEIAYRIVRPDGEVRWVAAKGKAYFREEHGWQMPYQFVGTLIDRSEHRHAEEAHSHLAAIVESSDDAILSKGTDGVIKSWNPGAERMFGYSADEIIGRSILTLIPEHLRSEEARIIRRLRAGEKVDHFETTHITKRGEHLEVSVTISPVRDGSGQIVGASKVIRDISQQKTAERRLRQAYKMEALGQFTGGIAHDFNNILAIIMGNLELIAGSCCNDPLAKEKIQQTVDAAERAADLTRRLLAFARQQSLDPAVVHTGEVVQNAATFIGSSLGATIVVESSIAPDLWRTKIDKNQLENALLNLAVNARDAMSGGGRIYIVCQNVDITEAENDTLGTLRLGKYVRISVRDTGSGMATDSIVRATEPFYTTKTIGQGTGLGLSMVYGFIKQSGGHLRISSELSSGTTVELYLPRAKADEMAPSISPPPLPAAASQGTETILIVEDEHSIRTTLAYALRSVGYTVLDAEDGPTAVGLLRRTQHIDLLLTDITLPNGMNGVMLAKEAMARHPAIKVIFSSGYTSNVLIRDYQMVKEAHLLTKPVRMRELFSKIRRVLDLPACPEHE